MLCSAIHRSVSFIHLAAAGTVNTSSIRSHRVRMTSKSSELKNSRFWVASPSAKRKRGPNYMFVASLYTR